MNKTHVSMSKVLCSLIFSISIVAAADANAWHGGGGGWHRGGWHGGGWHGGGWHGAGWRGGYYGGGWGNAGWLVPAAVIGGGIAGATYYSSQCYNVCNYNRSRCWVQCN